MIVKDDAKIAYELLKAEMREVDYAPYFLSRVSVKNMFNAKTRIREKLFVADINETFLWGMVSMKYSQAKGTVTIGCRSFSGKDVAKLRTWAKSALRTKSPRHKPKC
jgi:hypothetical protein